MATKRVSTGFSPSRTEHLPQEDLMAEPAAPSERLLLLELLSGLLHKQLGDGFAVLVLDLNGVFQFLSNPGLAGLTQEEVIGRHFIDLIDKEDYAICVKAFEHGRKGGSGVSGVFRTLGKDEKGRPKKFPMRAVYWPIRDEQGEIRYGAAVAVQVMEQMGRGMPEERAGDVHLVEISKVILEDPKLCVDLFRHAFEDEYLFIAKQLGNYRNISYKTIQWLNRKLEDEMRGKQLEKIRTIREKVREEDLKLTGKKYTDVATVEAGPMAVEEPLPREAVAMLFDENVPLESFGGKTPAQLKRQYLNQMARELYELVPADKRPKGWDSFEFNYDNPIKLGKQFKKLRQALGVTQEELSAHGYHRTYISDLERGHAGRRYASHANPDTLYKLLNTLKESAQSKA